MPPKFREVVPSPVGHDDFPRPQDCSMTLTRFIKIPLFVLAGALSLGLAGCKTQTKHPTPIPGYTSTAPTDPGTPSQPRTPDNGRPGPRLGPDPGVTPADRP